MPPKLFPPTKTFERSGGQSTFIHPPAGTRNLGRGTYLINPVEASYSKESPLAILRKHQMDMSRMARIAENQGEEVAKRKYGMVESALEDATMAGSKLNGNEEMRLLMQVDSGGKPVGAATFQKGDAYGLSNKDFTDLDFTGPEPGTLHSLGVLGQTEGGKPFLRGEEYIRQVQDMLGNNNVFFETINKPEFSNLEYYYNLGARPTGKTRGGGNPFYEFKQRAAREAEAPNPDQLRLPGMKKGGWIDFTKQPGKASRDLHVSAQDVALGEQQDFAALVARLRASQDAMMSGKVLGSQAAQDQMNYRAAQKTVDQWVDPSQRLRMDPMQRRLLDTEVLQPEMSAMPRTLGDELLDKSETMRDLKGFYDERSPGGKRAMLALSMLPAIAAPAAMGTGLAARVLTGAALNTAAGVPMAALDPSMSSPEKDAVYGAAFGVSPVLGLGAMGADALYEGAKRFGVGGSVAGAAKRMAQRAMPMFQEGASSAVAPAGTLSVVKPKGGNWINNSVEDALRGLKKPTWPPEDVMHAPTTESLNSWISGPLTKYVKRDLATPDDPVRRLAEEGVLHFDPRVDAAMRRSASAQAHRRLSGEAGQELGVSPMAKRWEDLTDSAVLPGTYDDHVPLESLINESVRDRPNILKRIGGDYAVANPDATAYAMNRGRTTDELGFNHLIDELSNALNPNSGLPTHLQLTPEAVQKMGIEKAVRRVADINAWRAEQKVAANAEIANKAMAVREYPHTAEKPNPKGLRWVELNAKTPLPDGHTVKTDQYGTRVYGPKGEDLSRESHAAEEDALTAFNRGALEKQLKYEGDTMGHCVGGYCDDVASGRSRIFSLRDAKGEPHVTVEATPGQSGDYPEHLIKEFQNWIHENRPGFVWDNYAFLNWVKDAHPEVPQPLRIDQIKGKQNRKPNDEYLPFVQDFVKNPPHGSPWGDVGDLQNSGLRRTIDAFNSNELKKIQEAGIEVPQWATPEDIQKIGDAVWPGQYGKAPGMAQGGSVQKSTPAVDIRGIMNAILEHHAHG